MSKICEPWGKKQEGDLDSSIYQPDVFAFFY